MIETLIIEALKSVFSAAVEAVGEEAARAACDDACRIRKAKAEADAAADAKFGPRRPAGGGREP